MECNPIQIKYLTEGGDACGINKKYMWHCLCEYLSGMVLVIFSPKSLELSTSLECDLRH
jgi:hypothetical protein